MSKRPSRHGDTVTVLFARVPRRGEVKTRLAAALGDDAALALHRAFLLDSIEILHRASARGAGRAVWFSERFTPDAEMRRALEGVSVDTQSGADLGERMSDCIARLLAAGARRVVILGSDSPTLPIERIHEAIDQLADRDVALGPAEDGGYYLVGARTVVPEMFRGIEWGGPRVFAETVALLKMLGVAPFVLPPWYDVDTPEDLARVAREVASLREKGRPRPRNTERVLDNPDVRPTITGRIS